MSDFEKAGNDSRVTNNESAQRYELFVDDTLAGFADYVVTDGATAITHTEVNPALNGRGLGSTLVRFALDDVRARGNSVVPQCPFVGVFIGRHPEYADLLA